MSAWLNIVGVGADGLAGLPAASRTLVETAELIVGGDRHLAMVTNGSARKLAWEFPLDSLVQEITAARASRVVVLATGDPMAFGIGSTLARHFEPDDMTILPAPGAFSLAAARLAWPLHGCTCLTLHGRPLELLNHHLQPGRRLLILSHDGTTPESIAGLLRDAGFGPSRMTVLESMGGDDESKHVSTADDWATPSVQDLNTVAVECIAGPDARILAPVPGLPDDAFVHDGQLTKRIVRAATIAALAPLPGQTLWDLGAGCASVAIEWLRAAQDIQGQGATAIAVERDAERCTMAAQNAARLGTPFLDIVHANTAQAIPGMADPDAVFIGGGLSGGDELVGTVWDHLRPGGRLVANVVTLEGERALLDAHALYGGDLARIAVSHADPVGGLTGWRPAMPVTQWSVTRT
ncbi:MAG: precorrin-6y C5,15-methyltransferase (decarboxylating) subunit CbiE [Rhodospirillaceae bacterium]|jgi:precorrin-6Y C5,15-methyltransferase (decarboxylating)|nr:precorrin-6y C5,15-methyltransferase (decarboxylating) subunit CbiE [Rhodospirillaceae bacterium]MBT3808948.1 precorrin-6y C5,15-methyltransferase (decarboxylating) subunit CbiE [Rhodospirillaceae bacterium]MBT3929591.1 precorrin-6y C5,15-methyltransferase (decarboxylating) subunit CbiE [Rhodospirillaceae bacterium]MBT4772806.1 precorrin-6y C5,15-methyltransferase (decarboxylating) subunit CbiE [Rhodospirillaceae bacterium]MBT5360054.1 precorrin-6y C5,15-methyltransferase (decarboxylating) s